MTVQIQRTDPLICYLYTVTNQRLYLTMAWYLNVTSNELPVVFLSTTSNMKTYIST